MTRRKGEITGLMNERDFPHLVELAFRPAVSGPRLQNSMPFTASTVFRSAAAAGGTKRSNFISGSAFPMWPLPTHSVTASGASA
jgi:hypothetical protein